MHGLEVVLALQMELGESPVWDHRCQCLRWVDINRRRIYAWQPGTAAPASVWSLDERIGCLQLAQGGGLLAATDSGLWLLDTDGRRHAVLAENPEWQRGAGNRFNDGGIDPLGRLWIGTLDREVRHPSAGLYRLASDGLQPVKSGLLISNGLAFSPDGRWLYHADSPRRQVVRHAFDPETGNIDSGTCWIDLDADNLPGVVDGAAVDSQGNYWCALYGGGLVACFDAEGQLIRTEPLDCPNPTMVAFGGCDLSTLFVTTARQELSVEQLERYPDSGSLFALQLDTPGLPVQVCQVFGPRWPGSGS